MAGAEKELASALGTIVHLQVSEAAAPGYRDMSGCICNLRGQMHWLRTVAVCAHTRAAAGAVWHRPAAVLWLLDAGHNPAGAADIVMPILQVKVLCLA